MRVLKTMNTLGEINRDSYVSSNLVESSQHQRRGGKTLEKVN
jgi:hypothetical protein